MMEAVVILICVIGIYAGVLWIGNIAGDIIASWLENRK